VGVDWLPHSYATYSLPALWVGVVTAGRLAKINLTRIRSVLGVGSSV
jgi:hypothetical protein